MKKLLTLSIFLAILITACSANPQTTTVANQGLAIQVAATQSVAVSVSDSAPVATTPEVSTFDQGGGIADGVVVSSYQVPDPVQPPPPTDAVVGELGLPSSNAPEANTDQVDQAIAQATFQEVAADTQETITKAVIAVSTRTERGITVETYTVRLVNNPLSSDGMHQGATIATYALDWGHVPSMDEIYAAPAALYRYLHPDMSDGVSWEVDFTQ